MFNLLIVEDEKIEREYLKSLIEKSNLPIKKVYTATNGQEAIELAKIVDLDIIILDIEMPYKNGLEALKQIREIERQESICFILSSYDKFAYAQQAIALNVENYILKPSSKEVILENVIKACNKLFVRSNNEKQMDALINKMNTIFPILERQCAMSILLAKDEIELNKQFKLQNIYMCSGIAYVFDDKEDIIKLKNIKNIIEELGAKCLVVNYKPYEVMFIIAGFMLSCEDIEAIDRVMYANVNKYCHGNIKTNSGTLIDSYHEAVEKISTIASYDEKFIANNIKDLFEYYENDMISEFKAKIDEITNELIQNYKLNKEVAIKIMDNYKEIIIAKLKRDYSNYLIDYSTYDLNTFDEMDIKYKLNRLFEKITEEKYGNLDRIVKDSLRYIRDNYTKQISLQDVADEMEMSPTYISRVFNKQLKKSFTDIINEYRVEKAKELIKTGMSLKEVTYQTGFRSQSYFTQIFKKITGVSPRDFQNLF